MKPKNAGKVSNVDLPIKLSGNGKLYHITDNKETALISNLELGKYEKIGMEKILAGFNAWAMSNALIATMTE